jgi:LPXTG-motif cell wall-anchored protein
MRQAVRRTVRVGGVTAVAIGAALVLAIPASAHNATATANCAVDGHPTVLIQADSFAALAKGKANTLEITEGNTTLFGPVNFGTTYEPNGKSNNNPDPINLTVDGTVVHHLVVKVVAYDSSKYDFTIPLKTTVCEQPSKSPTPTPTPTPTTPPTHTQSSTPPPATTTTQAEVAPAAATTTTPPAVAGTGTLPNTGVNVALPLGIAGALVVVGGGILAWMRFGARRKGASS